MKKETLKKVKKQVARSDAIQRQLEEIAHDAEVEECEPSAELLAVQLIQLHEKDTEEAIKQIANIKKEVAEEYVEKSDKSDECDESN